LQQKSKKRYTDPVTKPILQEQNRQNIKITAEFPENQRKRKTTSKNYYRVNGNEPKNTRYNYADPTNFNILKDNIGSLKDAEEEERWCEHCGALYFNGETNTKGTFHFT